MGGALVGVGTGVAVGFGVAVGLGAGWTANVAWTRASTVASISTAGSEARTVAGTSVGVSISGCWGEAEESGIAAGESPEEHPIAKIANSVRSSAVRRYILAPLRHSSGRLAVESAEIEGSSDYSSISLSWAAGS